MAGASVWKTLTNDGWKDFRSTKPRYRKFVQQIDDACGDRSCPLLALEYNGICERADSGADPLPWRRAARLSADVKHDLV